MSIEAYASVWLERRPGRAKGEVDLPAQAREEDGMAFMTWDESYSVNVREIDEQHRKLIEMLNAFYGHVGRDAKEAFHTLLNSLVDYTHYHFSTEERYFDLFKYPGAAAHTEAHRRFTEKVDDVRKRLLSGQLVLSLEITVFLRDWLTEHIKGSDRAYTSHFNQSGLT